MPQYPYLAALVCAMAVMSISYAYGDESPERPQAQAPAVALHVHSDSKSEDFSAVIKIFLFMTLLSLLPALLFSITSFTRIIIVLSFARQAFGVQNLPPNPVLIGLALFLTVFVMTPVWEKVYRQAYQPYQKKEIASEQALQITVSQFRTFMLAHTREKDLALMLHLGNYVCQSESDIPTTALIPAFLVSELTIAFQMGFLILLPFLIIDIIVASTLLAMGMMMLPPAVVGVPFKILLFILVDGWHLVVKTLVLSYT